MTTEAKVGIFTLVGIALLGFIVIHLSGFRAGADKSYTIYVGFTQVMGLNPGAKVRFAGVEAGTVKELTTDGLKTLHRLCSCTSGRTAGSFCLPSSSPSIFRSTAFHPSDSTTLPLAVNSSPAQMVVKVVSA